MLYVRWRLIYPKGMFSRSRPVIVVLISAQYYDSTADCDLSLAMMKELILKESIYFIEKQSFSRR
jgi:hypothetical protein